MWFVSDEALLAGLASGDPDAAAAFVGRFQRRVYGLARTIVGDVHTAEEVAQEAFLRAFRHAGLFDARRGSVATWLSTLTRNLAVDAMRVRRPLVIDPDAVRDLPLVASGPGPEHSAALADDVERLRGALEHLPGDQQRAVLLAGLFGHTAREVADLEGIPLGTAKTRIRTGLSRLRAALVAEEHTE